MALIRNGANLYSNNNRYFSAVGATAILSAVGGGASKRNWNAGWHTISGVTNRSALPDGYRPPSCWMMAQKTGGLSSRSEANFSVTAGNPVLIEGRNILGSMSFFVTVPDAPLQLIVSATGTAAFAFVASGGLAGAIAASGTANFAFTVPSVTLGAIVQTTGTGAIVFSANGTTTAIGNLFGDIIPCAVDVVTNQSIDDMLKPYLEVINRNVQKASKVIPASEEFV